MRKPVKIIIADTEIKKKKDEKKMNKFTVWWGVNRKRKNI
jgi:hypothetical protein